MITTEFNSFESTKEVARNVSVYFGVSVRIVRTPSGYRIVPDELNEANLQNFAAFVYFHKDPRVELLQYVDTQRFQSRDLIWQDPETGLAWDVSRIIYGGMSSDLPKQPVHIMNRIRYGGRDNWRLPTLSELGTLSMEKLATVNATEFAPRRSFQLWANEESRYSGPEKALLDLVSKRRADQYYKEAHKDQSGGWYTESAETMLVSSGSSD